MEIRNPVTYERKESEKVLYPPRSWNMRPANPVTMDELLRSNKELEQFAFAVSHDLQEPLKVVSLYLQILSKKHKERLNEEDQNMSHILDRTERMQQLIQSMLEYARTGHGEIQWREVDSQAVINRAMKNLAVTIEENSAHIWCDDCPIIMGDEIKLTQLFQNLIANAIKFHKKDELPFVQISCKQNRNQWLFSIKDNGIGVGKEHQRKVFEIFRRLHAQSEYAGTGIGLAMCQKIVKSHRGNIWIRSEIGQGATVYFNIPKPSVSSSVAI